MANLSLREAVKHFDVSRPTLQKALKSGKISGVQDGQGHWTIDPAELTRIYRPRRLSMDKDSHSEEPLSTPTQNHLGTKALEREVELLREMLAKAETNADHWRTLAERQQLLLEDRRPKGFFQRLFGR